jgi:hypothetical protein
MSVKKEREESNKIICKSKHQEKKLPGEKNGWKWMKLGLQEASAICLRLTGIHWYLLLISFLPFKHILPDSHTLDLLKKVFTSFLQA